MTCSAIDSAESSTRDTYSLSAMRLSSLSAIYESHQKGTRRGVLAQTRVFLLSGLFCEKKYPVIYKRPAAISPRWRKWHRCVATDIAMRGSTASRGLSHQASLHQSGLHQAGMHQRGLHQAGLRLSGLRHVGWRN